MTRRARQRAAYLFKSREKRELQKALEANFDAAFYLSKYSDVARAGLDPFEHYRRHGWREGRRPNAWFDPERYRREHPECASRETDPFLHYLQRAEGLLAKRFSEPPAVLTKTRRVVQGENGEPLQVVLKAELPRGTDLKLLTDAFDPEYYREQYPEVAELGVNLLAHYMTIGWIEGKDPSPEFSTSYYLRHNPDLRRTFDNPFLHYLKSGRYESWRPKATVREAEVLSLFESDPAMRRRLVKAKELEPMVGLPAARREVTSAPTSAQSLTDAVERIRVAAGSRRRRYVVAVPHIRMAGATRVAAIFAGVLSELRDPNEILVVTTDGTEASFSHWFPDGVERLDISGFVAHLGEEERMRCLVDLLRGIKCEALFNFNSRLSWDTLKLFGRQMSQECRIFTYLFTWDENAAGERVGYPIQWLRATSDYHHLIFTDTRFLADDISARMGYNSEQVLPLYTPVVSVGIEAPRPERDSQPRFLWASRLDRQKRTDVLIEIARANPDFVFDVYGKPVLDKAGLEQQDVPPNMVLRQTYTDLADVLATPYHGFLYTAQWDGMPTIVLDIADAGLPIVAPDVGGLSELIDGETGWLIADCTDVASYSAALRAMARDQGEARARADRLKAKLGEGFAPAAYAAKIREALERHEL